MAISTTESFLQSLEKSSLLDADQLPAAREAARQSDDPRALARLLVQKGLLTRWQAGQLLIGRTSFFLGRYKLIDLLGRGGMGNVFLAQHMMMNRTVAVKMISRQLSQDPASRERFIEEARAVAALDHPNIVHAYTVDSEDDRYYMVLEYIDGRDLQRLVESEGPLDYQQAADLIRQAADGLAHAHSKGMVHRDIKPSNLLVSSQGVVKILDMGMARLMEPGARAAASNGIPQEERVLGSVDYMAPEQGVQGPELDHRADIYSLGCTLYYLLTGSPPFPEGTLPERILKHQIEDPPGILDKRPGAPRDLVKICEKMMAKNPADRFESAGEVSALLAQWRPPPQRILKAVPLDAEGAQEAVADASDQGHAPNRAIAGRLNRWMGGASQWFRGTVPGPWRIPVLAGCGLLVVLLVVGAAAWLRSGGEETADSGPAAILGKEPSSAEEDQPTMFSELKSGPPGPKPAKPEPGSKPPPKPEPEKSTQPEAEKSPKPEKPSKPEPSKPEPSKPEPSKPEPSKPEPSKLEPSKPEPSPGDAFKDFPKAVDLPAISGGDAAEKPSASGVSLVQVHTPGEVPWALNLIGGERVLMNRVFTIQPQESADKKATWLLQLGAPARGKEEAPANVAKFWREGESLMFQWLEGPAGAQPTQLRNCALEVSARGATRALALRKPQQVEPITIDLFRPVVSHPVAVDWRGDPSCLRLQILILEGRKGSIVKPAEPLGLKTSATLSFDRKDGQGRVFPGEVKFEVRFAQKGTRPAVDLRQQMPQVKQFKSSALPPPVRSEIEEGVRNLRGKVGGAQPKPKLFMENSIAAFETRLWYDDFFQAVHLKGRLHFRVFADLGGYQLELARTTGS